LSSNTPVTRNNVLPITIEQEMKTSYLNYAMSVIVSRALPDCRDGLKPVHRRILFAMHEMNNYHDKPYKKSARIVGDVMGKYHPHGGDAIYLALVRMAQDFSLRIPLIDGQGNFGSMDGDSPAAMRYTESRLAKASVSLLEDIDFGTVDFADNYDGAEREPQVLPARFPNLLVNGANGIAVGMATNIPSHNLGEVIDACCAYIKNPEITIEELLQLVPGPDFPTGGIILGLSKARNALATGRGSIMMRSKTVFEEIGGRNAIIVKEIPYQVNKSELLKSVEQLVKDKVIDTISEIRDESNKLGVRIVIELKKDAVPEVVQNQLFKHTQLQTSFGVNMLALNRGRPMLMGLREVIAAFVDFREETVTRRISFQLNKARNRAHVLIGLSLAVANIDEVIALIKASPDPATAKKKLMEKAWNAGEIEPLLRLVDDYRNELKDGKGFFTDEQAAAILDMKLQRLTGLEKDKIEGELKELSIEMRDFLSVLSTREKLMAIIEQELIEVKTKFATPRRTEILELEEEMDMEDLIQREDMIVTITMTGFIKRVPLATYRAQRRGGKGRNAMAMYDDDATTDIIVASTHTPLLFFSDTGKVYRMKVYRLPIGSPQSKGKALVNMLPLSPGEKITNITPIPEDQNEWDHYSIIFATEAGNIRRNDLSAFSSIQANGKIAIKLDDGDKLIGVRICKETDHIMLCTRQGKALRFPVSKLRIFKSRSSDGVRGIRLAQKGDKVVSMAILSESNLAIEKREEFLKIPVEYRLNYRLTNDLTQITAVIEQKTENKDLLKPNEAQELALNEQFILSVTENGYGKRTSAYEYRVTGRGGQGVLNIDTSERNGNVIASFPIDDHDEIIVLSDKGTLIRLKVDSIRITGRNAMGVRIINLKEAEKVISITRVVSDKSDDDIEGNDNDDNTAIVVEEAK
jgi:DNA gyrase subunit A